MSGTMYAWSQKWAGRLEMDGLEAHPTMDRLEAYPAMDRLEAYPT
jgi:hypothetical protein